MKALLIAGLLFALLVAVVFFVCPHGAIITSYPEPTPMVTIVLPVAPTATLVPGSEYGAYQGIKNGHHCVVVFGDGATWAEQQNSASNKVLSMQCDKRLHVLYSEGGAEQYETSPGPNGLGEVVIATYIISRVVYYEIWGE